MHRVVASFRSSVSPSQALALSHAAASYQPSCCARRRVVARRTGSVGRGEGVRVLVRLCVRRLLAFVGDARGQQFGLVVTHFPPGAGQGELARCQAGDQSRLGNGSFLPRALKHGLCSCQIGRLIVARVSQGRCGTIQRSRTRQRGPAALRARGWPGLHRRHLHD